MILDTCALLWLAEGGGQLSRPTLEKMDEAPVLYVSAITGFEIGLRYQQRKLILPVRPHEWFEAIIVHHGLEVVPLDLPICLRACELPPLHRDPCDRFIIATALTHKFPVVTTDERFKAYGVDMLS